MDNIKDLSVYKKMFDEDVQSFNDFQALDYIRELKNQGNNDEAIYVGRTFLEQCPHLKDYINYYGYALYNRYINIDDEKIHENEDLFYSILNEIVSNTRQENYSPLEATISKAIKYETKKETINYNKLNELLDMLDAPTLDTTPFVSPEGKEYESKKEKWYRLKVNTLFHLKEYGKLIEEVNKAFASHFKWHFQNQNWLNYYRAYAYIELGRYEEAENIFIRLGNHFRGENLSEALYKLYRHTNKEKEANKLVIYDFFLNGLSIDNLDNYKKVIEITENVDEKAHQLAINLVNKLKDDSLTINLDETFDKLYKVIMNHLDKYLERESGTVVFYNEEKKYGLILNNQDERIYFRQADYIYDDEVYRRDHVEYTTIKTFDSKRKEISQKAILIQYRV